jgi:DNA-binding Xre family transcriptional regulator
MSFKLNQIKHKGIIMVINERPLQEYTLAELRDIVEVINSQIADLKQEEAKKTEAKVLELIGEKNKLGRNIYTKQEVAQLTGVSASRVSKLAKEAEEAKMGAPAEPEA